MENIFKNLQPFFGDNILLFHLIVGITLGVSVLVVGKIIKVFLHTAGRKLIAKTDNDLDDKILEIFLERIIALSGVLGLFLGIREVQKGVTESHTDIHLIIAYSHNVLYIVTAIIVTSVFSRVIKELITYGLRNAAAKNENVGHSLTPLANRVATFVVFALAAVVVLDHFGQNITSIITLLGAGSLAIGLAAQDTISNMISGFIIMLDRPFRIGDRIKIPSGEVGDIFEIGLRSTKILDFDNNLIIVPNNELIKTKVINFGYPAGEIRVVVDVSAAYGVDIDRVKSILAAMARKHPGVLQSPVPEAFLMSFGESALNFRLVCRVGSFQEQFAAAENIRVLIYNEFKKQGIEIPFPHRVVHVTSDQFNDALHTTSKRKKISR
jgi:small-conductance mechanosensitive channel